MSDPAAPLWRAAQVFRLLSWVYALVFQLSKNAEFARPMLGWVLFGALTGWSLACAVGYLRGFGRRRAWVLAEVAVVVALMASTPLVASASWTLANQTWPTTLWATNAVVSAAVLAGPVAGMLAGLIVMGTAAALKGSISVDLVRTPTILIELAVGLAVGMAASTAPTGNEIISMLKTTSLVTAVPYSYDLYGIAVRDIGGRIFEPVPMLMVAATWYLVVTSVLMVGQFYLERYFSRGASRKLTTKQLEALAKAQAGTGGM